MADIETHLFRGACRFSQQNVADLRTMQNVEVLNWNTMWENGQLVVPRELHMLLGLRPNDRSIAYGRNDQIIFKKVEPSMLERAFDELVKTASAVANASDSTDEIVSEEVKEHHPSRGNYYYARNG